MRRLAAEFGPQSVAFSQSSPSTTAIGDSSGFVRRLMNAFGTLVPNSGNTLNGLYLPGEEGLPKATYSAPGLAVGPRFGMYFAVTGLLMIVVSKATAASRPSAGTLASYSFEKDILRLG